MAKSKSAKIKEARRAREASLGGTLQNAFENQKQSISEIYDRHRSERGDTSSGSGGSMEEGRESTQPKAGGTQAGGTAPGSTPKEPEKPKSGLRHLWDTIGLGGMNEEERNAAASRTQAANAYMDEQRAILDASKALDLEAAADTYKDRRTEEKRMNSLGKEAEAAYKPNEEQERFAKDARRYSAERNAAREREAAAEKKSEVPATPFRSGKPAPGVVKPSQQIEQYTDAGTGRQTAQQPSTAEEAQRQNPMTTAANRQSETAEKAEPEMTERQSLIAQRDALQDQYTKLYTLINSTGLEGYDFDASAYDRLDALDQQIRELNNQIGIESRVGNILAGATGQYASGLVNSAGTTIDALATAGELYGNASPYAGYATDELSAETIGTGTEKERQAWAAEMQRVQDAAAEVEAVADSLGESAARDLANAKDGLSGLGQAGVDIATNVIQMGYDAALGKIPGVGSLAAMFVRSAGSSAQEARQEGADVGEQLAYGITKGGIEAATEKLFDGVAGIFGKGAADDMVEGVIRRLARTDTGRTVLRALAGAGGEGTEELISDLLSPFAEMIYKDESLGELFQGLSGSEILYDFLIGAAIGGLGSGGSIATGQNAAKNAEARQADAAEARVNSMMDGAMEALENPNAGQNQNAPVDPAQVLAEQVTGPQAQPVEGLTAEDQRAEQRQQRQKADEVVDTLLGPMADAQAKEEAAERVAEILATPTGEAAETPQEAPETPGDIPAPPTAAETNTGESQALNSGLANEGTGTGQRQTTRSANEAAQGLIEYTGATSKPAAVAAGIQRIADYIQSNNNGQGMDEATVRGMAEQVAADMLDTVSGGADSETYDAIRNYLKGMDIQISDELRGDVTDYNEWRKSLFGKLNLRKNGLPIDTLYGEMNSTFGEGLFPSSITAQADQINQIIDVLDNLRPKSWVEMASQEEYDAALEQVTQMVLDAANGIESSATALDSENFASLEGEMPPSMINGVETVPSGVQANGPTVERGFAENVRTTDSTEEALSKPLGEDKVTYERLLNKDVLARAQGIYSGGYESAKSYLDGAIRAAKEGAKLPPEAVPLARMVANEMTRNGDVVGAERLIADVAAELTQAGQLGQVARILRQSITTPEGKLYGVQKTVEKLNEQAGERYDVELPQELIDAYNQQTTDEGRDDVITRMQQAIADQIPATWMDKYTALRYTAMLGNLKTQTRNVVGNLTSMLGRMAKDRIAAVMEYIGYVASGGQMERTKSFAYSPSLYKEARNDFENVQDEALGEKKYSDSTRQMDKEIEDRRRIFKSRVLEGWRLGTKWAMEEGDVIFSRANYADALAGWLAAHKITADQWSEMVNDPSQQETVDRARAYAIQQAQEATFRDNNDFSRTISQLGRNNAKTTTGKVLSAVGEGIMPFRKTPANILVRAEEYSPIGLINTAVKAAQAANQNSEVTASDVIEQAAKALTGTGVLALGYMLANKGLLRGKDKDEEQENFDKLRGAQDWSIRIGNRSYTMDWVAPYSIPLFMGAQLEDAMADGGLDVSEAMKIIRSMSEPMLEMSMLDGINDAFEVVQSYNSDTPPLELLAKNALASLLSQAAPTLLGQIERYGEDYRQTTYTDPNGILDPSIQRKVSQTMAKIPGIPGVFEDPDFQQQDYIDAWGRKQETPQGVGKFLETFVTPWYSSENRSTPIDDELQRLYQSGVDGADKVYPDYAKRNPSDDLGRLNEEEYETYATTKGQTSLALVQDFIESEEYQGMEDKERAEIIQNLYTLANDSAKTAVIRQRGEEPAKLDPVTALVEAGMEPGDAGGLVLDIGGDGKVRQADIKAYYASHKGDEAYLRALWDAMNYSKNGERYTWEMLTGKK